MAAGAGTDVRDAALFLFTQTAAEHSHTQAHEQVCVCVCVCVCLNFCPLLMQCSTLFGINRIKDDPCSLC